MARPQIFNVPALTVTPNLFSPFLRGNPSPFLRGNKALLTTQALGGVTTVYAVNRPGRDAGYSRGRLPRSLNLIGDGVSNTWYHDEHPMLDQFLTRCLDGWDETDPRTPLSLLVRVNNTYFQPIFTGLPVGAEFRYTTEALQAGGYTLDPLNLPADTTTLTVTDAEDTTVVFEFDIAEDGVVGGRTALVPAAATIDAYLAEIMAEVTGSALKLNFQNIGVDTVTFRSDLPDPTGNLALEATSADVDVVPFAFTGGGAGPTLYLGETPVNGASIEIGCPPIDTIVEEDFASNIVSQIVCYDLAWTTADVQLTRLTR